MAQILIKQTTVENLIQDLANLVQQDELATSERGNLTTLTTFDKSDLVHAINEVNAEADLNRDLIDTINDLIGGESIEGTFNYSNLDTIAQTLIGAINENKTGVDSSIKKADNLSDLTDVAMARVNLEVYSQSEVETLIHQAEINLGSNYSVATEAQRDLLEDLTIGDNVFIKDAGDGKWAIDKVVSLVGNTPTFERIMDEDIYLNSISAESIKATYESNDDTNAYIDADKTKVNHLTITSDIDLDKVIQNDELNTDGTLSSATNTDIASSLAIKTYVDNLTLKIANNLSDLTDISAAREALDVYSKSQTDYLVQNIEFQDPQTGETVNIGDMVAVVQGFEKAKKNYFFGLDILGALK